MIQDKNIYAYPFVRARNHEDFYRVMDRFHFIDVKPSIDRKETASIRDAIFQRAKEKAARLTEEKSENYTSQVQNDVMEIARTSVKPSPMNPFNRFKESMGLQKPETNETEKSETSVEKVVPRELKHNIQSVSNENYAASIKDETMRAARNQFKQETNLMATLSFLNTKAAIKMAESAHSKINRI